MWTAKGGQNYCGPATNPRMVAGECGLLENRLVKAHIPQRYRNYDLNQSLLFNTIKTTNMLLKMNYCHTDQEHPSCQVYLCDTFRTSARALSVKETL